MKRTFLAILVTLSYSTCGVAEESAKDEFYKKEHSGSTEYLPGIEWPEPQVVTPGKRSADPPSDAIILFNGSDLSAWEGAEKWKVENGVAIVGGGPIHSKQSFGDCQVHLEWSSPTPARGKGQGRGNSGIFLMSIYEVQILDSYNNKTYFDGQAGAVYKQSPPMVNATRPPGEWNTYDIVFTAPRFADDDSLESPAYVTVVHNGVLLHNHFPLSGRTLWYEPANYRAHPAKLPIKLQDHGNPVRYRNIWVREFEQLEGKQVEPPKYHNHKTGEKKLAEASARANHMSEGASDFFFTIGKQMASASSGHRAIHDESTPKGVVEKVPRFARWKPIFQVNSAQELAECFDQFQITIAVLGKDNKVHQARELALREPIIDVRDPRSVREGYVSSADLSAHDHIKELANKSGINEKSTVCLVFFPFSVEAILWDLERKADNAGDTNEIRETEFVFAKEGDNYQVKVKSIKHF